MSNPPVVVRLGQGDLYIGRAPGFYGRFGNPYLIGTQGTRDEVCDKFEVYARKNLMSQIAAIPPGARLECFCVPKRCHGDTIVKLWKEIHGE